MVENTAMYSILCMYAVYHQDLIIVCSCIWFSINVNTSALVQTGGRGVGRSKNDLMLPLFSLLNYTVIT